MPQLQNELAEKELIKNFRHDNSWLGELKPKGNWVNNDVIKIPRQGAAPNVLINNNIYPIVSNRREDDFIVVSLNKYETENTTVTDDELYAMPYEKVSDVQVQHREELEDKSAQHALHSIAVAAHSAKTPVMLSTGPDDGTGRKRLITADLINYGKLLGDLGVPEAGRVLVLSNEHKADLLHEDSAREKTWMNMQTGQLNAFHVGFKLYSVVYSPRYAPVGGVQTRQSFGAVTGKPATISFFSKNACKAVGSAKRYAVLAENDPKNRENTIGFRLYFLAVGIKDEGFGAIISG